MSTDFNLSNYTYLGPNLTLKIQKHAGTFNVLRIRTSY